LAGEGVGGVVSEVSFRGIFTIHLPIPVSSENYTYALAWEGGAGNKGRLPRTASLITRKIEKILSIL